MSWSEIQSIVAQVKGELGRASDETERARLQERLNAARRAITEIEGRWDNEDLDSFDTAPDADLEVPTPSGDGGETYELSSVDELLAELLIDHDEAEALSCDLEEAESHSSEQEVSEAAITTARTRFGTRKAVDGVRQVALRPPMTDPRQNSQRRSSDQPAPAVERSAPAPRAIIAFVLTAVIGTIGVLLLTSGERADETQAAPEASAPATSGIDELREILAIIGAGNLEVDRDGTLLRISGDVMSVEQLQIVTETAAALVDDAELDTTGIVVADQPSLPASESSSAETDEPEMAEPKLQRDLERLLGSTPIMFEPGESGLGELDRRILNSVIAVILAAPDAEVVIIGHADQEGSGRGSLELASARAEEVGEYLVSRGVKADALTTEGVGAPNPSGIPSAIELVVGGRASR